MHINRCQVSLNQLKFTFSVYFIIFMYLCKNHEHCKDHLHGSATTYWYSVTKYTFYKAKISFILIHFKLKIKKRGLKGKITTFRHKSHISIYKKQHSGIVPYQLQIASTPRRRCGDFFRAKLSLAEFYPCLSESNRLCVARIFLSSVLQC